jgi:hypothetical protein
MGNYEGVRKIREKVIKRIQEGSEGEKIPEPRLEGVKRKVLALGGTQSLCSLTGKRTRRSIVDSDPSGGGGGGGGGDTTTTGNSSSGSVKGDGSPGRTPFK